MKTRPQHYSELLGLDNSWRVADVDLDLGGMQVRIGLETTRNAFCCSACGAACALKDHAPHRQWRHLDTMQFETILIARVPRTNCPQCGVKTCEVPWAEPHGRFTLMFEAFAIQVLQAAASMEQARQLLNLNWTSLQRFMDRAVERGLFHRKLDDINHVGMDEKSFETLKDIELKTSRAWAIREQFRWFWEYRHAGDARKFFALWYQWDSRCHLEPVKKVARMIKGRLNNILTWFRHRISNGTAEGFNSRIQSLKSAARGFRNFDNYRIRILFYCGKLNLLPQINSH